MDVLTTISTVFGSVKAATEIAQYLRTRDLSLEKAEAKNKLADLIGALADVKMQLADVRTLLLDKDEEIRQLQEELKIKSNLVFESPYYWLETEEGKKEGPYCPACKDEKNNLSRLIEDPKGRWTCAVCEKSFLDKNYNPSEHSVAPDWDPLD